MCRHGLSTGTDPVDGTWSETKNELLDRDAKEAACQTWNAHAPPNDALIFPTATLTKIALQSASKVGIK